MKKGKRGRNEERSIFCALTSNIVSILFLLPLILDRREKEGEFGILVGCYMLGNSGGGIIAILMQTTGLFTPLWVGVGTLALAAVYATFVLVESKEVAAIKERLAAANGDAGDLDDEDDDDDHEVAKTVDKKSLALIVAGAVADNIGSVGLARKLYNISRA